MTGKLALTIAAAGVTACALLGARQARIQAAHELAESRFRQLGLEQDFDRLRSIIADRTSPAVLDADGGMSPVVGPGASGAIDPEITPEPLAAPRSSDADRAPPEGDDAALGGGVAPAIRPGAALDG